MNTQTYFENLKREVDKVYSVASEARSKGYDPVDKVEIPLAMNMAEKVVGIISTLYPQMEGTKIAERILELEKEYGKLDSTIVFKIGEEVAKQKFCKFENPLQAIEAGIRIGFGYQTIGVVSSPLEGFTGLKVRKTREGKDYIEASFSGPIRSAGTTASVICLMLIDYLREMFGFAKYDPTEDEIKRTWAELEHFHDRITNLQGMPTEDEALYLARRMPIQIAGDASEKIEVPNYKNLERVDTDYLRSGFCLILAEALAQKAKKGFRLYNHAKENGIKMSGFDWLDEYVKFHEKREKGKTDDSPSYIKDLVAGRPIFGHPSKSGGFRFRYGRGRVSGFSATSIHPATMAVTDEFLAIGTQLKIEKPTKGCVVTVCDSIDGPIVKLFNGSVKKLNSKEETKILYPDIEEIIYLGDLLFPFSDLANRNAVLVKPGYVEEWWALDLNEKEESTKDIDFLSISLEKAIEFSGKYKIPLHPKYIFYWTQISNEDFKDLMGWLENSRIDKKIILPFNKLDKEKFKLGKRALELLGVEHQVTIENVVINEENSKALLINLGIDFVSLNNGRGDIGDLFNKIIIDKEKSVLENINSFSKYEIKDKAGEFIGTRMGRPEKAKLRKLIGSPNVLFPIGKEGGRLRSVQTACVEGKVWSSFPLYYCEFCKKETIYPFCENCNKKSKEMYYFSETKEKFFSKNVEGLEKEGIRYTNQAIDINCYYNEAIKKLGLTKEEIPLLIKGVRGTSSANHAIENLSKGFLRAKYDLQVNKDGTIRFDATELPLVCFKPKEAYVGVEKLKEMGYVKDMFGEELKNENQILELMPHDVLLPSSFDSLDEKADDVFLKVSKFVDDELDKFYGMKRFYNVEKKEDLIGQLGVFMAPHNCAGVICRFIGFSNTQGLFASPYMHAAVRRDCFDYNTYIPIKRNGNWRIVKLGEFVENLNPLKIVDDFGTKEKKVENFETIGFDKKIKEVRIDNFTKHAKVTMFEIKTKLGKKIKVTENHKFLIDGKIKRASDLNIADKLPLPIKINISERDIKQINLLELLKDENLMVRNINKIINNINKKKIDSILKKLKITKKQFMNYKIRESYPLCFVLGLDEEIKQKICKRGKLAAKRNNVELPMLIKLSDELLELIGLYVAEGFSRSVGGKKGVNQVYISASNQEIRDFIKKTMKNSFGLKPTEKKQDRVTFSSKILYLLFTKILEAGKNAKEKRIPYLFLNLPLKRLACVLRGYFEGDGSAGGKERKVSCDSVSEDLLYDLEFCLARFGIFAKRYEYEKLPGPKVREFYIRKKRKIPKFRITKLIIGSDFVDNFYRIGFLSERKNKILESHKKIKKMGMRIDKDENFVYDPIISIERFPEKESYCLNINSEKHLVVANSIVSKQCDGDEAAIMLLGDVLLNFSREFLPSHRGGTQDAPLVLNAKIDAGEVDDQILDFEFLMKYPLELYRAAEKGKHSSEVKINTVRDVLGRGENPFINAGFTHDTENFNEGVLCSSYKKLLTMKDKVRHQMELVEKLRSVDTSDTARLIIERHFIRDIRGNLRKFSMQEFRCVGCNEIVRRTPLNGVCPKCRGKLIFTIHEGGIKKYLEPALDLAKKYNLSKYMQQNLELVKRYIESIFGRELEKQEMISRWF